MIAWVYVTSVAMFINGMLMFAKAVASSKACRDAKRPVPKPRVGLFWCRLDIASILLMLLGLNILTWKVPSGSFSPAVERGLQVTLLLGCWTLFAGLCIYGFVSFRCVLPKYRQYVQNSGKSWRNERIERTAESISDSILIPAVLLYLCSMIYPWKLHIELQIIFSFTGLFVLFYLAVRERRRLSS